MIEIKGEILCERVYGNGQYLLAHSAFMFNCLDCYTINGESYCRAIVAIRFCYNGQEMGDIIVTTAMDKNQDFFAGIGGLLALLALQQALSYLSLRSTFFRRLVERDSCFIN